MASPVAVLDACVLYPAPLRSLMMHAIVEGCFQGKWTYQIHDEWIRNLILARPDISRLQATRISDLMDTNAGDCLVTGYEKHIDSLDLPDYDDRHVLAAAIKSKSSLIVTFNLRDFPATAISKYKVTANSPDDFLCALFSRQADAILLACRNHRSSLKKPPSTPEEYVLLLRRQRIERFADLVANHLDRI